MHIKASVNPLPANLNPSEPPAHGCQDNLFNENNRVNRSGHRVFSDTVTRLDDRSISEFENLPFFPPDLEEPEVEPPDLLESYEVITDYPVLDWVAPNVRRRLLEPEQVWKQKAIPKKTIQKEPEALAKQTTTQKEPEQPPVMDALTGMPTSELEHKVWEFLTKVVGIASPVGRKIKGAATHVVSGEKIEQLQTGLKNVLKDQVHYEVNENMGRRMLQLSKVCGSTSRSLPALSLLGYAIPGYRFVPAMLALWRLKDFKDEMAALYYDRNATPALVDLTLSWVPTLARSLL